MLGVDQTSGLITFKFILVKRKFHKYVLLLKV